MNLLIKNIFRHSNALKCIRMFHSKIIKPNVLTHHNENSCNKLISKNCYRNIQLNAVSRGYEGDGKTTISILNKEGGPLLMIDAYAKEGFRLSNGAFIIGPVALFPFIALQWDIESLSDINESSLSLFRVLEPKLDVLVIGIGDGDEKLRYDAIKFLKNNYINFEVLSTHYAVGTYNYLVQENRVVAAAMIPPMSLQQDENDPFDSHLKRPDAFYDQSKRKGYWDKFDT